MRVARHIFCLFFVTCAMPMPLSAQSENVWAGFWNTIGGSYDVARVGGGSVEARPLRDNADEIIGARFFKERGRSDPMAVTNRSLAAFGESCRTQCGTVLPNDDSRLESFRQRVMEHLTRPTGMRHQWRGTVMICDTANGEPLAGFVALAKDNSEIYRSGDPGSQLIGSWFGGLPNTTAIYLYKPDRLPTRSSQMAATRIEEQRVEGIQANMAAARQAAEEFQRDLAVGDETNCGTVIEVRGPMAEIAVPISRPAPNGANTFWSRRERLFPAGTAVCTFGL